MNDGNAMLEVDEVIAATDLALLCSIEGTEAWIPKSQMGDSDIDMYSEVGDSGYIYIYRHPGVARD